MRGGEARAERNSGSGETLLPQCLVADDVP